MTIERVSDTARWVADYRAMEAERPDALFRRTAVFDEPILDCKWGVLKTEQASCRYETAPTDLTDGDARRALFARVASGHDRVLVIAEGLLIYLAPEDVHALATDLHGQPAFRQVPGSWIWALFALLQTRKQREIANRMAGSVMLERA